MHKWNTVYCLLQYGSQSHWVVVECILCDFTFEQAEALIRKVFKAQF